MTMSPQKFFKCFENALEAMKLLNRHYEKEINIHKAKIIQFYSFPSNHVKEYLPQNHCDFNNETLHQSNYNAEGDLHKRLSGCGNQAQSSHCNNLTNTNSYQHHCDLCSSLSQEV